MAQVCPRCARAHRGPCGIPPRVSVRAAVGIGSARANRTAQEAGFAVPRAQKLADMSGNNQRALLTRLLAQGQDNEAACVEMLRQLSPDMPEFTAVQERLDKLQAVLETTRQQLARLVMR